MSAPIKAILAGAVLVGTGGTGIWLMHQGTAPEATQLAIETAFKEGLKADGAYNNKYASKYANFLVGLEDKNNDWWNWSFSNRYSKSDAKGGFAGVVRAIKESDQNDNSLKSACEKAYKSTDANVVDTITDEDSSKFVKNQVWEYCSFVKEMPKTLKDMNDKQDSNEDKTKLSDTTNGWGVSGKVASGKQEDLLAIYTPDNALAWDLLESRFSPDTEKTGFFADKTKGSTIRKKCETAYGQNTSAAEGTDRPSDEDLYKWCSLKGYKAST